MQKHYLEVLAVAILTRIIFLKFTPSIVQRSVGHAANEDWNRLKEEVTLYRNPDVQGYSEAIQQPPLFLAFWKLIGLPFSERLCLPALESFAFLSFMILDFSMSPKSNKDVPWYPFSTLVFALNPFSNIVFGAQSVGIVSVLIILWIFIELAKERTTSASILCALGCYLSIFPGYLILAVLAKGRESKTQFITSLLTFSITIVGLLGTTALLEGSWGFLDHCYLSNIYARNTAPNLGLFWYMYVEMFVHFDTLFVWSMQLLILAVCFALFLRFYDDPPFLALLITMTTGVLRPYNSMADFGCSLALAAQWRHLFKYMNRIFILGVLSMLAVVLAPLFFFTWLQTGTSNANFYFAASILNAVTRVQLISQFITAYARHRYHQKYGQNPHLSTGARIVPAIRP